MMNPPSFSELDNIEEYLQQMADFLADHCAAVSALGASDKRLLLARIVPDMTPEHWAALAARHGLQDWHVLPLPRPPKNLPGKNSIMVRADEKKFLFSGSV